ncbi:MULTISPECIES: mechanosensitive ion channel family protein [Oceanobacillus]|uniref:Mechanosensitive ion channel protein MscS n=1 Tax=Oceanobacillus kimchii TaxID=746691 RepID=A0ABQ5TPB2_9BACI|nr:MULTISPECIES: mechanosensitive ion channel family protein [Oceanobacillus]MBT2599909.1 mechanosensitive ion channel family protein [Oceanobacillus sp. ISL-74]MBT2652641.1 mechanosensitive ion channel family protein [Oceanobacillus sp. ISL-73]MCT1577183.1 mechanosensitive ion channel family protein [Oceanobacillus kimchii]MCT2135253.1 mechanosensitive ion channel family protein [Oceanobacillus kimchii]OEH56521.1 mechanosensitive ion channel protein MscS [Oceanobacillus sp. E9]
MDFLNRQWERLWNYLSNPDLWVGIFQGALQIVVIILLALLIVKVTRKFVDKFFVQRQSGPIRITERRENTLKKLIKNVVAYVVYFLAIVMILGVFNFEIGPLLAGAGVAGLAIGFGAQNLVRDIISGFFIIFEDQFSVGDYVAVSGVEGTVEEIGLRTTKILSWTGELNVVPNGNVTQVTNYSIHNGLAIVDVNIPYESDVYEAEKVIEEVAAELPNKYEFLLEVPQIIGVQSLDVSHYVIRIIADTSPGFQWAAERNIRKELQDKLFKSGIELPASRIIMYSKEEKERLTIDRDQIRGVQGREVSKGEVRSELERSKARDDE